MLTVNTKDRRELALREKIPELPEKSDKEDIVLYTGLRKYLIECQPN